MLKLIRILTLLVALVALGGAFEAAAAQAPQTKVATTVELAKHIDDLIEDDEMLEGFDIDVEVKSGVAVLTGKVRTQAQKSRAAELARVQGITSVDNRIVVDPDAPRSALGRAVEGTKGAAKATGEYTKEVAGKVAEGAKDVGKKTGEMGKEVGKTTAEAGKKVGQTAAGRSKKVAKETEKAAGTVGRKTRVVLSSTGETITDAWITSKVKSQFLADSSVAGLKIDVDTDDRVVTLTGTVASAAERDRAIEIAKKTEGVEKVVDRLTIRR